MSETIQTKCCSKCKKFKQFSEFSRNRNTKDGHQAHCKICCSKYKKEYIQTERGKKIKRKSDDCYNRSEKGKVTRRQVLARYEKTEKGKAAQKLYYTQHPKEYKAHTAVNNAIRVGKMPRASSLLCSCGKQAAQYHHHLGYEPEHWLDVVPICIVCHNNLARN